MSSFSQVIPNPKAGTYYTLITSNFVNETKFNIEFNTTSCDLSAESTCGEYTVMSFSSSDTIAQNITLSSAVQYLAVTGSSAIFGLDTLSSAPAFVQLDVDAFPSGVNGSSFAQQYNSEIQFSLSVNNSTNNYVFGLQNDPNSAAPSFEALVWIGSICPNNCNSQGTCDVSSTQCTCNDKWTGRYCQVEIKKKKKLSTLYIILIIIGGAIVLAILIGVPVALFLNNRKKARYERV